MSKIWIVVADEAKSRILATDKTTEPLVELDGLTSPEATMSKQDLVSDKSGRSFDSGGQGRHAMGNKTDPKEQVAIRFAKELADHLEKRVPFYKQAKLTVSGLDCNIDVLAESIRKHPSFQ